MNHYKRSFLVLLLLSQVLAWGNSQSITCASENQYSNQLLKLNVNELSDKSGVNVTLVTSKPYKMKLNPIKKSDDEYVIFLPNTYHSITSKQPTTNVDNDIQDVNVKLVPNVDSQTNNGYTKVTIKTKTNNLKLDVNNEIVASNNEDNAELLNLIAKNDGEGQKFSYHRKLRKIYHSNKSNISNHVETKHLSYHSVAHRQPVNSFKSNVIKPKIATKVQHEVKTLVMQAEVLDPAHKLSVKTVAPPQATTAVVKNSYFDFKKMLIVALALLIILTIPFLGLILMLLKKFGSQNPINIRFNKESEIEELNNYGAYSEVSLSVLDELKDDQGLEIIEGIELASGRGLYIVQLEKEKALIGVINSNIFVLKRFSDVQNLKFNVKNADDKLKTKDLFIVQLNNWRGLIRNKQNKMKLEFVF